MKEKCCVLLLKLPTSNEAVDIFEQTITGGFSSINTRLVFDTEILLPNLINEEKPDEFEKNDNNKICYNIRLNNEKEISKKKSYNKNLKVG